VTEVVRGRLLLGTQGFAFDDWVGPFYPPGTAKADYLARYAERFATVEIDSTFYGTPRSGVVLLVRPHAAGFVFAAKFRGRSRTTNNWRKPRSKRPSSSPSCGV
jgi:uncharacterized protein YecE (DUF72 family)